MKILYVCFEYPPLIGGGSTYNASLIRSVSGLDNEVIVYTSGKFDEIISDNGATVIRSMNIKNIYENNGDFLRSVEELINIIKKYKPEIIHSQQYLETLIAQVANKNFKTPLVVTHHKTPEYKSGLIVKNAKWSCFDFVNNKEIDHYISPSKAFTRSLLQSIEYIPLEKITNIYPGLPDGYFRITDLYKINKFKNKINLEEGEILIVLPMKTRKRKGLNL